MTETAPQPVAKPRRRLLRGLLSSLLTFLLIVFVVGAAGLIYLKGRAVTVPDWLQTRIEARIAREIPQADVSFGEMVFVVDDGWAPKVRLHDITARTPEGVEIVSFNEFKATFALAPLFEGVVQPQAIALSGVFVTLVRDENGRVRLSGGTTDLGPSREAATLPELIGQLDGILMTPALNALSEGDIRAITLRYIDKRTKRAWTGDGGRLRLIRDGDDLSLSADLAVLSGGAGVATLTANYESVVGEGVASFGIGFEDVEAPDIAAQGAAFAWLDVLRAPISGSVRSGLNESGAFEPVNATLQIGRGVVQPTDQTQPIPFDGARSYFSYDPAERLLRFDELSVQSLWVSGQASGTASLGEASDGGVIGDLVGQFTLKDLKINPQNFYPEPVSIAQADLDFQMKLNPFRLQLGRLQIADQGQTLSMSGALSAGEDGWEVALDGQMDGLAPKRLLELWPAQVKPKTRRWLAENLLGGQMRQIDVALRQYPEEKPLTYLAFDFEEASVRFLKSMPPVAKARGHLSLTDNRLVVAVDQGHVVAPQGGRIILQGSSFIIPDVGVRDDTPAVIRLETRSSVTAALSMLNQEPLGVMDKVKFPVDLAQGQAVLRGTLALPLEKDSKTSDVIYHAQGIVQGVSTDILVKDRALQAARLELQADNDELIITGPGRIDGVNFAGTWRQPIGEGSEKSALRGQVALDQETLDIFGIGLPQGMIAGAGSAQVGLDFERGAAPRFKVTSDLHGLRVRVPQVSWVKPRKTAASLEVSGALGDVPRVDHLRVKGAGLTASGNVTLKPGGSLERVRFERVQVGGWLDIPVDLNGQGSGKAVQVVVRGGKLDLRTAEFGSDEGSNGTAGPPSPPMLVQLDRLQITDTIALTNMRGRFGTNRGLDGAFEALLNGGTPVRGQVIPQGGRSAVRLVSADAGGVLRSAGLLKQVVGGNLSLTLLPVGSGGGFDGRLTGSALRVKDAPGIAALLNAISVVGLINELNGDGIYFDQVEGDFRLTPDRITLTNASAVGASMGISMDGVYGTQTGNMRMQGVISPVYLLNGIGSLLTRKGEGVIGFNYTLTGPATAPKVSVNPLSALAPGMFRELFRRPAPELQEVDGITTSTLPNAKPRERKPVDSRAGDR